MGNFAENLNLGNRFRPPPVLEHLTTAFFTSVPVDGALEFVKALLQKVNNWKNRTYINASQIINLLEFCLTTTYFKFRGQIYQQYHRCAMGLPVSPIINNVSMENFEVTNNIRFSPTACLDTIR